jgi:hypothetical protein
MIDIADAVSCRREFGFVLVADHRTGPRYVRDALDQMSDLLLRPRPIGLTAQ